MGSHGVGHDWSDLAAAVYNTREGNGTPLQCSCLENPRDGVAWWATIYGVAQSRTRLKQLSSSSSSCLLGLTCSVMLGRGKGIADTARVGSVLCGWSLWDVDTVWGRSCISSEELVPGCGTLGRATLLGLPDGPCGNCPSLRQVVHFFRGSWSWVVTCLAEPCHSASREDMGSDPWPPTAWW